MDPKFKTPYPAVKTNPTLDDCMRCIRTSDYMQLIGATAATWGYGFIVGKPARFAVAGMMAGIGFTFGTLVVVQNTRGRLMGFRENEREMKRFATE
jgi:NADH-ubiquinone oxidoreductase complex I, 21 kDa subunit